MKQIYFRKFGLKKTLQLQFTYGFSFLSFHSVLNWSISDLKYADDSSQDLKTLNSSELTVQPDQVSFTEPLKESALLS